MLVPLPAGLREVLTRLEEAGGRPYVVGGAVRDALLGLDPKDFDVEVFGLSAERLKELLSATARVNAVGEAFTVFKLAQVPGVAGDVDVALPRRDSKAGPGHRGIATMGDPSLPLEEAARRRDFTVNALMYDARRDVIVDPVGGRRDLASRVLRAVDPATFADDPLRALRAVQMAARFALTVEAATAELCSRMPLAELPRERVWGEMEKLLVKAPRPSLGFALLREWGLLGVVAPELIPLADTPQDPQWHPEGDVWIHTLLALDQAALLLHGLDPARQTTVMLGTLCHDLGKPATTELRDGRLRSHDHEQAGVAPTLSLLDRWNVHSMQGYDVRGQVVALVANHLKPGQLYEDRARVSDGAVRRLAAKCEADLLYRVARADCLGRTGDFPPVAMEWFLERVRALDVAVRAPAALLRGRDLLELGLAPGPDVGRIVRAVYEKQLDGEVTTLDDARAEARRMLADAASARG